MFHYIAWSFDGVDTISIYVDGVLDKETVVSLSTVAVVPSVGQAVSNTNSVITQRSGEFDLQYLRVVDRALTPAEIAQNYQKLRHGTLKPARDAPCLSGADCTGACINGGCQPYSYYGGVCDGNEDCVFGDCIGGICGCGNNLECNATSVCVLGECVSEGVIGDDCDEDAGTVLLE